MVVAAVTTAEGAHGQLFALYLDQFGYGEVAIGSLASVLAIFRLVSRVPSGAAYGPDRARGQIIFWLAVFTLMTSGYAFAGGNLVVVTALTIAHGYAFGALGTYNLAATIDLTEGRRAGATMGWYTAALSTGYAIGAPAGGFVAEHLGNPAALGIFGLLPLLAAALVLPMPKLTAPLNATPRPAGLRSLLGAHAKADPRVWLAFLIVLYINVLSDSVDTFFPLFGLSIGISKASSGLLKGLKSGAATFIRFISGVLFRYLDHRAVNFWGVLLFGAATIALSYVNAYAVFVVVFVLAGVARGLLRVTSAASVAELRREGQDVGIASGIYNMGLDVGAIIGPAVGGFVGSLVGLGAMFQLVAIGSLLAYFAISLATPQGRAALAFRGARPARAGS